MRVAMIPFFMLAFYQNGMAAAWIFIAAAITDFLDGYLARKWNMCSPFGAFVDPVADKLMVATALVLLAGANGPIVAVPCSVILCREIGVSALREWMAERGKRGSVAVGWSGKVKTACQMVALTGLLLSRSSSSSSLLLLQNLSMTLLYIATLLTVTSG